MLWTAAALAFGGVFGRLVLGRLVFGRFAIFLRGAGLLPGTTGRLAGRVAARTVGASTGRGCGTVLRRDVDFQCGFHALEGAAVARPYECDRFAVGVGAGRTPYAMHVVLRFAGYIIVDYQHHILYVDAAGQQVGGHNHLDAARAETANRFVALLLVEIGVDFGGFHTGAAQVAGQVAHTVLRCGKDDYSFAPVLLEQVEEDALLVGLVAENGRLLDFLHGA